MNLWGRIFAAGYDRLMAKGEREGLSDLRQMVVGSVSGRVLEIGAGTGLNLSHYGPDVELVLTEPEAPMVARLRRRLAGEGRVAEVIQAPAQRLPLPDDSVDCVVATLVLCTVPDPAAVLSEIRRVLRPGGRLYFLEHVRAEDPGLAKWQDRLQPVWLRLGHGCHCNRDTLSTVRASGFALQEIEHGRMPAAPPFLRPLIWGSATAAG